jgi:GntR family transcriptional repressor for pyruvate dehydrogenase complex
MPAAGKTIAWNRDEKVHCLPPKITLRSSPRLPDQIASILAERIKKGFYPPGVTLPSEAQLGRAFEVSRAVVREALSQLKYEGLLKSRQGKGVIVLEPSSRRSFRMEGVERMPLKDLAQFYEMRAVLESETAALAAARHSVKDLGRLRDCLERMARAVELRQDGSEADLAFHLLIAEMSANRYLRDLMQYLTAKAGKVIRAARTHSSRKPRLPETVQKEHAEIFAALAKRDQVRAKAATLRHLRNAARRLGLE